MRFNTLNLPEPYNGTLIDRLQSCPNRIDMNFSKYVEDSFPNLVNHTSHDIRLYLYEDLASPSSNIFDKYDILFDKLEQEHHKNWEQIPLPFYVPDSITSIQKIIKDNILESISTFTFRGIKIIFHKNGTVFPDYRNINFNKEHDSFELIKTIDVKEKRFIKNTYKNYVMKVIRKAAILSAYMQKRMPVELDVVGLDYPDGYMSFSDIPIECKVAGNGQ